MVLLYIYLSYIPLIVRLIAQAPVTPGLILRWQDSVTLDSLSMADAGPTPPCLFPSVFCNTPMLDSPPLRV